MRNLKGLLAITVLISSLALWPSCQSTKSSTASKMLKFNLQNGKGYDYETTINMDQEIMGQDIQADMTTYYSMDVVADSADTRTLQTRIERFKMKSEVAGLNIEVDTDKPLKVEGTSSKDSVMMMLNRLFGAIRGRSFTMKVNAEGKVLNVIGLEDMAKTIADSMALDEAESMKMQAQFDKQFNGEEIRSQFERFWYIFPNREVKVGETWNKKSSIGGSLPGSYNSTYTVKDIEGDMVTIEEKTKVEGATEKEKSIELKGDVTGTIVIDSKLGLVVSADQDMVMKAEAMGMKFEIKGKSKTKGTAR